MTSASSFVRHGGRDPASPVVLSVPHAGREYPLPLRAALRVPLAALVSLEDRHVDSLALAARGDGAETLLIAQRARAWIDLNRSEQERDPQVEVNAPPTGTPLSAKLRSGLGLVPRRVGGPASANIWQRRLTSEEIDARIRADHWPYHAALHEALAAARDRFGSAVLLDIHSMPPLSQPQDPPQLVFGDRFGKAAGGRFLARLQGVAQAYGVASALNTPYPGGHVLDRHGAPAQGIHAIQIEFDRRLYLDAALNLPGPGFARAVAMLRAMIDAVADEAQPGAMAAE